MDQNKKVAVFVETSCDYGRRILAGVAEYLRTNLNWTVFLEQNDLNARPHDWILSNQWDGILCRQTDPVIANILISSGIPLVDLNDQHQIPALSRVGSDHNAIGMMGAQYLKNKGFRHFAYCGFSDELWSRTRKEGFEKTLAESGSLIHLWESPWTDRSADYWTNDIIQIRHWIKNLPKPIGIMAANDTRALHLIQACNQIGIVIPEQVAVIGVDDEEMFCELVSPRLSSIRPDCERIGFQAAELLDQMMSGSASSVKRIVIPPRGIIIRPSTDIGAVSDSLVVKAIRLFRITDSARCDIKNVARELNVSTEMLEKRFRRTLNCSCADFIRSI